MADAPAKAPLPPDQVRVINSKDEVYRIPAAQAEDILKFDTSFRPVTPEDDARISVKETYGGALGTTGAGALGLARGLAGPLPDIAGSAIGGESYKQLARNLEIANPGAVTMGEAAGLIAPALFSGGSSLAARTGLSAAARGAGTVAAETIGKAAILPRAATALGEMAAKGVEKAVGTTAAGTIATGLKRSAAFGAQMAAENALFDASKQLSDDIVQDHEFHAENYVASAMRGALTGAAFGVPLGFVGGVLGKTVDKYASRLEGKFDPNLGKSAQSVELEKEAYEHAIRATGAKTHDYRKYIGNRAVYDDEGKLLFPAGSDQAFDASVRDMGKELLKKEDGHAAVNLYTQPGDIANTSGVRIQTVGKELESIHNKVKDTQFDLYDSLKGMVDDVVAPTTKAAMTDESISAARSATNFVKNIANKDFIDTKHFEMKIRDGDLAFIQTKKNGSTFFKDAGGFYRVDGTTNQKVYENINPFKSEPATLDKLRGFIKNLDDQLPKQYEGLYGEKALLAQHYMTLRGVMEEQYENVVRKQFGEEQYKQLADLNKRYGIWKTIEKMSMGDKYRRFANQDYGLKDVQQGGIMSNIGTHVGILGGSLVGGSVGGPIGGAVGGTLGAVYGSKANKFIRERQQAVVATAYNKLSEISQIQGISKKITDTANKYIDAFVDGTARSGVTVARTGIRYAERLTNAQYQKSIETVQKLNKNPQALMDHVSKALPPGMANTSPEVAASVVTTYQNGINYLATKMPAGPRPMNVLQPTLPAARALARIPSDGDRDKWSRYVAAMENPLVMLQQAAAGRLDRETVETVKTIYPQMFAKMRQAIVTRVAELKTPLTMQQTTALSMILDTPLSAVQQPDTIAMFQAAFDQNFAADGEGGTVVPQEGGQNEGASKAGPSGKTGDKPSRPIDIHGVFKTTTQGMRGELR